MHTWKEVATRAQRGNVAPDRLEAEYAALLSALRIAYQETLPRWGGQIVRVQGDGLLAMFGHPVTREDDGRRAVDAAELVASNGAFGSIEVRQDLAGRDRFVLATRMA